MILSKITKTGKIITIAKETTNSRFCYSEEFEQAIKDNKGNNTLLTFKDYNGTKPNGKYVESGEKAQLINQVKEYELFLEYVNSFLSSDLRWFDGKKINCKLDDKLKEFGLYLSDEYGSQKLTTWFNRFIDNSTKNRVYYGRPKFSFERSETNEECNGYNFYSPSKEFINLHGGDKISFTDEDNRIVLSDLVKLFETFRDRLQTCYDNQKLQLDNYDKNKRKYNSLMKKYKAIKDEIESLPYQVRTEYKY